MVSHGYKNVISGEEKLLPMEEALSRHVCSSNTDSSYVDLLSYNFSSKQTSNDRH